MSIMIDATKLLEKLYKELWSYECYKNDDLRKGYSNCVHMIYDIIETSNNNNKYKSRGDVIENR